MLRALEATRRGLTVDELLEAASAECSKRTLYRDLQQLQEAGFPLVDEEGRWRVLQPGEGGLSLPVDPTQLLALSLTEDLLAPIEGSSLAESIRELRTRLLATLTPAGRAFCEELRDTAIGSLFGPVRGLRGSSHVRAVEEAIGRQHKLHIRYRSPRREPTDRTVRPYCTWYAAGRVYLVAWCERADDVRTFALQRLLEAEVLDEAFEADPGFNPVAFTRLGFGVFHGPVYHVVVDFSTDVAHLIRERRYHETQRVSDRPRGVRLTMDAAGLPEVAAWVAGFGASARPIAPPELVEAVRELHEGGLRSLAEPQAGLPGAV